MIAPSLLPLLKGRRAEVGALQLDQIEVEAEAAACQPASLRSDLAWNESAFARRPRLWLLLEHGRGVRG